MDTSTLAFFYDTPIIIEAPYRYGAACLERTGLSRVWYEPIEDEL